MLGDFMQDNEKKERTAVLRTCARREECTQEIFLTKYIIFSLILCSVLCVLNFAEGAKFGYYATCFCFVN
jgi:hypothetical protein